MRHFKFVLVRLCIFILFLSSAFQLSALGNREENGFVAGGEQPWESRPFEAPVRDLLEAASAVELEEAKQAKVLLHEDVYTILGDGRVERQNRWVYEILDEKGVENWASTTTSWSPWYQHRPEVRVRVSGPDGKDAFLDPSVLVVSAAESYSDKIYSDTQTLSGPLPHIRIGSVIEELREVRDSKPFFRAGSVQRITWFKNFPVAARRVVIRKEEGTALKIRVVGLDHLEPVKRNRDGFEELVYLQEDCPRAEPTERDLAPDADPVAHIAISTGSDWAAVNRQYLESVNRAVEGTDLSEISLSLKGDSETQTINSIVKYLNDKVRYTGMELGENSLIPFTPRETLDRGWGDCKDKSVLLTQLLKGAGIPAYPALVRTNSRRDINPDMPGLGDFNHCIVFVDGEKPLWIDPTSDFLEPGTIGIYEQDRHALIIREGSDSLVKTSREVARDNRVEELYEYRLTEKGFAELDITKRYHGSLATSLRSAYNYRSDKELKENMAGGVKKAFRFGEVESFEYSEPRDLSTPFEIRATVTGMGRAVTEFATAVAAVMQNEIVDILPSYFLSAPGKEEERESDFYFSQPMEVERTYRIIPPRGFVLEQLPKSRSVMIGPLALQREVTVDEGVITIRLNFSTGEERLSGKDALYLKKNASAYYSGTKAISLNFYHEGEKLLSEGDYQGSLAKFREYAAGEDVAAIHHIRLAKAYLTARLGNLARQEIETAVEMDPENALAWYLRGLIYQSNEIGRSLQPGFDLSEATLSYRKAAELDDDNYDYRLRLADLLTYNERGVQYAPDSASSEAVELLEALIEDHPAGKEQYENKLLFAVYFSNRYEKVAEIAEGLANKGLKRLFIALSRYFLDGMEAMNLYLEQELSQNEMSEMKQQIAGLLVEKQSYADAAVLMRAAAVGSENAFNLEYEADLIAEVVPFDVQAVEGDDPEALVTRFLYSLFQSDGVDFSALKPMLSEPLFLEMADSENEGGFEFYYDTFIRDSVGAFSQFAPMMDRFFSGISLHVEEAGKHAFEVKANLQETGFRGMLNFFMVREGGELRIASFNGNLDGLGASLIRLTKSGNRSEVERVLEWLKERYRLQSVRVGEPLDGFVFVRMMEEWDPQQQGELELVLAALAAETGGAGESIAPLTAATKGDDRERALHASAALVEAYRDLKDPVNYLKHAKPLYEAYPESSMASLFYMRALLLNERTDEAYAILQASEQAGMDEEKLAMLYHEYYGYTVDYAGYKVYVEELESEGKVTAVNYNLLSWLSLFKEEGPGDRDFLYARKAVKMTESKDSAILHTLACLYADAGRCNEAVNLLDELEELSPSGRYTSADWYLYGRIAEQYGIPETARSAYAKVQMDENLSTIPVSCWTLVQNRYQILGE